MHFLQANLGNWCGSVFVQRAVVTREVKLLVDIKLLVVEDYTI